MTEPAFRWIVTPSWPLTKGADAEITWEGQTLVPPFTTGGAGGGNLVAVPIVRHTYCHWEFWSALLPWHWRDLVDLACWLVRGDRDYVVSRYFSRWAREPCSEFCECKYTP